MRCPLLCSDERRCHRGKQEWRWRLEAILLFGLLGPLGFFRSIKLLGWLKLFGPLRWLLQVLHQSSIQLVFNRELRAIERFKPVEFCAAVHKRRRVVSPPEHDSEGGSFGFNPGPTFQCAIAVGVIFEVKQTDHQPVSGAACRSQSLLNTQVLGHRRRAGRCGPVPVREENTFYLDPDGHEPEGIVYAVRRSVRRGEDAFSGQFRQLQVRRLPGSLGRIEVIRNVYDLYALGDREEDPDRRVAW
ncbi:MAG: hypothetical protein QUV05_03365 [Phycisphaerae bacterium]|nr:hypothetical protein [Phycisphaerae bacterium]